VTDSRIVRAIWLRFIVDRLPSGVPLETSLSNSGAPVSAY
jgi:hypothetical protein